VQRNFSKVAVSGSVGREITCVL